MKDKIKILFLCTGNSCRSRKTGVLLVALAGAYLIAFRLPWFI
ncbi:MAG: hypothetical protein R6V10_12210 [bacterium]